MADSESRKPQTRYILAVVVGLGLVLLLLGKFTRLGGFTGRALSGDESTEGGCAAPMDKEQVAQLEQEIVNCDDPQPVANTPFTAFSNVYKTGGYVTSSMSSYNTAITELFRRRTFSVFIGQSPTGGSDAKRRAVGIVHNENGTVVGSPKDLGFDASNNDKSPGWHQEPTVDSYRSKYIATAWQGKFGNTNHQIVTSYFAVNKGLFVPAAHSQVNDPEVSGNNNAPDLSFFRDGRYVVSWAHEPTAGTTYKMAVCDKTGCGPEIQLGGTAAGDGFAQNATAMNNNGDFVVAIAYATRATIDDDWNITLELWTEGQNDNWTNTSTTTIADTDENEHWPDVVRWGNEGFVVSWQRRMPAPDNTLPPSVNMRFVNMNGVASPVHEIAGTGNGNMYPKVVTYAIGFQKLALAYARFHPDNNPGTNYGPWSTRLTDFSLTPQTGQFTEKGSHDFPGDSATSPTPDIALTSTSCQTRAISYVLPAGGNGDKIAKISY